MDTTDRLKRALKNPSLIFRGLNRLYHRRGSDYNTGGIDVFDEDWDNLIILDACRYDVFEKVNDIDGRLEPKQSRGSQTTEFLRANVRDRTFDDTVYVTANLQYHKHFDGDNFAAVYKLFQTDWDDELRTVLPGDFVDKATEIYENHTDKRLLFHLVQPHKPFVGTFGTRLFADEVHRTWNRVTEGETSYTDRDLYAAYVENLVVALPHVERLLDTVEGKSVVTADHGEMIGERAAPFPVREYGHPRGIYVPELVEIPWLVVEDGDRRDIESGMVSEAETVDEALLDQRLRDLGYK